MAILFPSKGSDAQVRNLFSISELRARSNFIIVASEASDPILKTVHSLHKTHMVLFI